VWETKEVGRNCLTLAPGLGFEPAHTGDITGKSLFFLEGKNKNARPYMTHELIVEISPATSLFSVLGSFQGFFKCMI